MGPWLGPPVAASERIFESPDFLKAASELCDTYATGSLSALAPRPSESMHCPPSLTWQVRP